MTRRDITENYYAVCEDKVSSYGIILKYGSTAGQVRKATLGAYPVGITLQSTKKFDTGVETSSVRLAFQKTGLADVKMPSTYSFAGSLVEGMAIQSDASGCVAPLLAASYINGSYILKNIQAKQVGIVQEKILGNAGGYAKVFLTPHLMPKP
jgi:hypothetical protein